jgi:LAO/AO transport system kinase
LVDALDAHRAGLDLPARRLEARRRHALDEFVAEHGERGLRALGGRLEAQQWLARQDAALDLPALAHALEARAQETR